MFARLINKFLFFVLNILLLNCGNGQEKTEVTATGKNSCTLIFIDKSVSVDANKSFVAEKYQRILKEAISQNIQHQGDRLEIYFIHENTAKGKAFEGICRSEIEDLSNVNATDAEAIKTAFELSLQKEKMRFEQVALQKLSDTNTSLSNQATDIQASISIIDKLSSQGFDVKVYYLSDMVESMKGANRRDFDKNPPKDQATAEALAKEDAKVLTERFTSLGTVQIKMALPFEPTSTTQQNNPTITTYWQTLFAALGILSVEELY